jgi:hypothetical protein
VRAEVDWWSSSIQTEKRWVYGDRNRTLARKGWTTLGVVCRMEQDVAFRKAQQVGRKFCDPKAQCWTLRLCDEAAKWLKGISRVRSTVNR